MVRPGSSKRITYIGMDTETVDGKAVLICTPNATCWPETWGDVWRFLSQHPHYVVWNLSYDALALLAFLPRSVLAQIRMTGRAEYRGWRIYYLRGKRLTIARGVKRERVSVDLWDAYPYYDAGLDRAALKYLKEGKLAVPRAWLEDLRPILEDAEKRAELELYCRRDASLTERLWEIVEAQYLKLRVEPWRAASPATIARRMFPTQYQMREVPKWAQGVFRRTLYGGRSETYRRGNVGKAYAYDIHSAYPSIIRNLTDPRGMEIVPVDVRHGARRGVQYGAYRVRVKVPIDDELPPVPLRRREAENGILFPTGLFTTWLVRSELDLLARENYDHKITGGIEIIPKGRKRRLFPKGSIEKLYALRTSAPALNIAIKKTLNSLYGKYAQSRTVWVRHTDGPLPMGARYVSPGRYTVALKIATSNTHYAIASEILARTRVRLWYALKAAGAGRVCCMTDGFVTTKIPRLDDRGPALGQWGRDRTCDEFVGCGTGIYFYRVKDRWYAKRRGIPDARFGDMVRDHPARTIHVPILCARTLAEAARTGYVGLNRMEKRTRAVSVNLDRSRYWETDIRSWAALFATSQRSQSWVLSTRDVSRDGRRGRLPWWSGENSAETTCMDAAETLF